jgi:hypothetical protein
MISSLTTTTWLNLTENHLLKNLQSTSSWFPRLADFKEAADFQDTLLQKLLPT